MIVLAGDVGATHTRIGLFNVENRNFHRLAFERFETKKFSYLGEIVQAFLKTTDARPRAAAFGIAGPVIDGVCRATNLPWTVDVAKLSKRIGIPRTTIVNDFVARAYGLHALSRKDVFVVQRGKPEGLANRVVIGPGTGLGEAFVAQHGGDSVVLASEGGHTDFGPQDGRETELLEFLRQRYGHVSYERILSRQGIVNVYEFVRAMKYAPENPAVRDALARAGKDKHAMIMRAAHTDKLSRIATDLFFSVLGAEAGNLALQGTALGGVFITGSFVRENVPLLKKSPFLKRFNAKGRMGGMMKRIPVYVVKNEYLGLLGAAAIASRLF